MIGSEMMARKKEKRITLRMEAPRCIPAMTTTTAAPAISSRAGTEKYPFSFTI
jgi:hypothetical protein